jgi:hypothetical protein
MCSQIEEHARRTQRRPSPLPRSPFKAKAEPTIIRVLRAVVIVTPNARASIAYSIEIEFRFVDSNFTDTPWKPRLERRAMFESDAREVCATDARKIASATSEILHA